MGRYLHGNAAYIVLEGGEGLGKTTVIKKLAVHFNAAYTREPGGTNIGSKIREITHYGENLQPAAELLLMNADRAQLLHEFTIPNIQAGRHVISDRSWVSSLVYQGIVRKLGKTRVKSISKHAIGEYIKPDLLFILHAPREVIKVRRSAKGREKDRFEKESEIFHDRVVKAYLKVATELNAILIDASGTADEVFKSIRQEIQNYFDLKSKEEQNASN
jgi:dTMP kinase